MSSLLPLQRLDFNLSVGSDMDPFHPTMAVVAHDGNVSLIPPGISKTSCSMDIRNYPFENFTCDLKFGSWVHDGLAVIAIVIIN